MFTKIMMNTLNINKISSKKRILSFLVLLKVCKRRIQILLDAVL